MLWAAGAPVVAAMREHLLHMRAMMMGGTAPPTKTPMHVISLGCGTGQLRAGPADAGLDVTSAGQISLGSDVHVHDLS